MPTDEVSALVAQTRAAQGKPRHIEDAPTLEKVAGMVAKRAKQARHDLASEQTASRPQAPLQPPSQSTV